MIDVGVGTTIIFLLVYLIWNGVRKDFYLKIFPRFSELSFKSIKRVFIFQVRFSVEYASRNSAPLINAKATRSPGLTPLFITEFANRLQRLLSSSKVRRKPDCEST